MKKIIKLKVNKNRSIVLQTIRQHLYPVEEFPEKFFPGLPAVLFGYFMETIKSRKEYMDMYREQNNKEEIEKMTHEILGFKNLLQHSPHTVVLMYQAYIKKFIKYKHTGSFTYTHRDEWEDIFQEVITRLIADKMSRIRERFDFAYHEDIFSKKSFFTSYLMVTVRNIYMDIIRERNVRLLTGGQVRPIDEVLEFYDYEDEKMLKHLAIYEEFHKLHMILALFHKGRPKLELCLKLKCRIPLTQDDIYRCFPG